MSVDGICNSLPICSPNVVHMVKNSLYVIDSLFAARLVEDETQ